MKDNFLTKIVDTNIATALAMIVNLTIWAHFRCLSLLLWCFTDINIIISLLKIMMSFGQKKNTVSLEIYVFTITNLQLIGWYRPLEKKRIQ